MKIKYLLAEDNPMFPSELKFLIRFVRPEKEMKCAMCGKKTKKLWTMLVPFRPQNMNQFALVPSDELKALTAVCEDHPLSPIFAELSEIKEQCQ